MESAAALTFVAVAYGTLAEAQVALAAIEQLDVVDAAIVVREPNGRIDLRQTRETSVGEGAIAGGTVGLLAGLLLAVPVGAALAGLLAGAGWGARDSGIEDERLRRLGEELGVGQAVLCVLVERERGDELTRALEPYGGEAVGTDVALP